MELEVVGMFFRHQWRRGGERGACKTTSLVLSSVQTRKGEGRGVPSGPSLVNGNKEVEIEREARCC